MKIFEDNLLDDKSISLKKIAFLIILISCCFNLSAQGNKNIKLGIDAGTLPLSSNLENLGLFLKVEPKIKVLENTFFGLRLGLTLNAQTFDNDNKEEFIILEEQEHAVISIVPTLDYYFGENNAGVYLGLGAGAYFLSEMDVFPVATSSSGGVRSVAMEEQLGFLLRGGFEFSKLRFGLEYNLISNANVEVSDTQVAGTVNASYFGMSVGFIFGFGRHSS